MAALDRITIRAGQCGGKPCVRGMRIRVSDVLGLLDRDFSLEMVLRQLPDLVAEDVSACREYAEGAEE